MDIQFDRKSFLINGERIFLNCAAIHYFRMPRAEWREVLVKAKLAGLNCIDTYFAWNIHEPQEGEWDFAGDKDCGAFIDLCAELGLYVIARPGPYICAEWDFGGFPWWLATKEEMIYRTNHPEFMHYTLKYFDQIIPIIAKRQLTRGGSVLLVQVENEYGYLADDESGKQYMLRLRDEILARDIEVPLITCDGGAEDTIEGANFWSGAAQHYEKLSLKQPNMPKLVTEFWTGWFEHWGGAAAAHKTAALYEKRMLEVLAAGFDGISHYMFFGGTNFGGYGGRTVGSSDIFMITSYDYHAPLNEYGRTTSKYFQAKKIAQFIHVVEELLLESESIKNVGDIAYSSALHVTGRGWGQQNIWFAENKQDEQDVFYITLDKERTIPLTIQAGGMIPVLDRFEICDGVRLTAGGLIIGNEQFTDRQLLLVSGGDGQRTELIVEAEKGIVLAQHNPSIRYKQSENGRSLRLDVYHFREPSILTLLIGDLKLEIIVLDSFMTERAWRLQEDTVTWLIGYEDIQLTSEGGIEVVKVQQDCEPMWIGAPNAHKPTASIAPAIESGASICPPTLGAWEYQSLDFSMIELPHLNEDPQGFTSIGQDFGYILYTHRMTSEAARESVMVLTCIEDTARVYVNGKEYCLIEQVGAGSVKLPLVQGTNTIQLLVQQMGRLNFSPYLGEEKGVSGSIYMDGLSIDLRHNGWVNDEQVQLDTVSSHELPFMFSQTFEVKDDQTGGVLVGTVFNGLKINGQEIDLKEYRDWFRFHKLDISDYIHQGINRLEMPIHATPVPRLELLLYHEGKQLKGWHTGVIPELPQSKHFQQGQILLNDKPSLCSPTWFRCQFDMAELPSSYHIKLKLRLTGMSKGFLLLNGHQLGRFWQIGPQEDYKIPVAWLRREGNELTIFDEEGRHPQEVRLLFDQQSQHRWFKLKCMTCTK